MVAHSVCPIKGTIFTQSVMALPGAISSEQWRAKISETFLNMWRRLLCGLFSFND